MVQIKDKQFDIYIPESRILERVSELSNQLNQEYATKEPVFISVLNGSFMFAADLMKRISIACHISFMRVSSYESTQSTGKITEIIGLQESIKGRHVVIVEDIVDTALTMSQLLVQLKQHEPASLEVATLLCKREAMQKDIKLKYVGFDIPNAFVVGYGLDYDGLGRNLPDLYVVKEEDF
ncbi:hypoxanthine phosphoribosyltransferase [Xanthocytophaga agilis]|uniref:Hypoxanthine phosphoribosyltransferase n=1 Tax=Xanthocytophaga agilis TaxID=3048010 RepID=A0AAE3UGQ6_9BACT|nr:hypoxanthine phosphoribosyltransferase [Xanthocytophaga agilis]MDJ1504600.1 hypoxanthine phosphoribosyltransferase [Xanthocytophaga agilis]